MPVQERLRQQIEEIKEQEANYDADAALAMAMFEHSEVPSLCPPPSDSLRTGYQSELCDVPCVTG